MKIKYIFSVLCLTTVLSGCSENGFWFRSGSNYDNIADKGVYYIGQPYRIKGVLYTPAENMSYSERGVATWYSKDSRNRLTTNGELFDDEKMTAAHKTLPLPSLVRITNLENGNTAIVRVNDRGPAVNNRLIDVSRKTAEALEMPETGTTLVQVDILPAESRRLKQELEKYQDEKMSEDNEIEVGDSTPIYKPDEDAETPIYNGQDISEEESTPEIAVDLIAPLDVDIEPVETPDFQRTVSADASSSALSEVADKPIPVIPGTYRIQAGVYGNPANAERTILKLEKIGPITTKTEKGRTTIWVGSFKNKAEAQSALAKVKQSGYADAWIQTVK